MDAIIRSATEAAHKSGGGDDTEEEFAEGPGSSRINRVPTFTGSLKEKGPTSLFIFSEDNFIRRWAKILNEWRYPFYLKLSPTFESHQMLILNSGSWWVWVFKVFFYSLAAVPFQQSVRDRQTSCDRLSFAPASTACRTNFSLGREGFGCPSLYSLVPFPQPNSLWVLSFSISTLSSEPLISYEYVGTGLLSLSSLCILRERQTGPNWAQPGFFPATSVHSHPCGMFLPVPNSPANDSCARQWV